jgi:protein ImuB
MNGAAARPRPELPGPSATLSTSRATARPPAAPLWLCLGLSRLPLEVRGGGCGEEEARIIVDRGGRVVQASETAADCGIAPGLPLNAALALCPGLVALERDEAAERAALERLAAWAGAFTSLVSIVPPAALLLDIRGSLRLFGGLESLRAHLREALRATGHAGREAVAPTPLAALWLARAGQTEAVTEMAALAGWIGRLRPPVTGWPEATLAALRNLGIESLADCLRLPRDGFARRIGRGPLADLDRALGRRPDPRPAFRPPCRYRGVLELAAETADTTRLARALAGLFAELEGFLRTRQRAVSRLLIRFSHLRQPATELTLGLVSPGLEAAHFNALFAERVERLALPAPVISVALEAEPGEPFDPAIAGLFGDTPGNAAGFRLVERLRARLGRDAVHGLGLQDDHRPEHAWRVAEPGAAEHYAAAAAQGPRPAWLLEAPRPLGSAAGRPRLDGPLTFESGPERLEGGWWDGREIARDYWIARTPTGARLWIFRDLSAAGQRAGGDHWFLHGLFG